MTPVCKCLRVFLQIFDYCKQTELDLPKLDFSWTSAILDTVIMIMVKMVKSNIIQTKNIIIATGSEVELAVSAAAELTAEGKKVRVVSMPATDAFDKQDAEYRESVLPSDVTARIAVEAGIADFWYKYVGFGGKIIGMTTFGESAPAGELFKMFGFTTENVVNTAKELLA